MSEIILTEFFAKWCPFCQKQNQILDELERDMKGKVEFFRIDIDDNRDLFNGFKIDGVPTLFILKNKSVFKEYSGLTQKNELELTINKALNS